ncbi:MAG: MerR family transcriptional regulator [Desulfovibrionales bacterium]|nr:MerR family transcriptional regulator [Desulfovibrionales bacterium]
MTTQTDGEVQRYRIGRAAKRVGVEPYVLRFWEQEFPHLRPDRSTKGQRFYTEEHVRQFQYIRRLLHEEKLTIKGVRQKLEGRPDAHTQSIVEYVRYELEAIRHLLM